MELENILKDLYQEDMKDEFLLDEAIATIEQYFEHTNYRRERPLAIAYLALKHEKRKQNLETNPEDTE